MLTFSSIETLKKTLTSAKQKGQTIGFVPTMGALHEGHLSLIKTAKTQNDLVICSIFVNPTQFNNPEDLAKYPRTLEADSQLLQSVACDVLFAPSASEMYPSLPRLNINFGSLETVMEGAFRPGHFNGVGIVVAKLFNIVAADDVYFGQKDFQQCMVIRQLIADLSIQTTMHICPTLREADGLAMSSRNRNLTPAHRAKAPIIYQTLLLAQKMLETTGIEAVKSFVSQQFEDINGVQLEYFEIANAQTLAPILEKTDDEIALCIAVFFGKVRLIDNLSALVES